MFDARYKTIANNPRTTMGWKSICRTNNRQLAVDTAIKAESKGIDVRVIDTYTRAENGANVVYRSN